MITQKSQKQAFLLGPRAVFGMACLELKKTQAPDLTIFTADTHTSAGLKRFKNTFPDDLIDVSIAEQILISASASFALEGLPTIATTFAPFLSMRGLEMIRHNMGYMKSPLVLAGLASGVALGNLGYTHCAIEDTAILKCIPNIQIYTPAHPSIVESILSLALRSQEPAYIRLTGAPGVVPWMLPEYSTPLVLPLLVNPLPRIVILSVGYIATEVKKATDELQPSQRRYISHYAVSSYSPDFDEELCSAFEKADQILIVEEAIEHGFCSCFALEFKHYAYKLNSLVHPSQFLKPGSYEYMLSQAGIDSQTIKSRLELALAKPQD